VLSLQVRERYAAESSRASERHEREIQRLRDELERCRAELLRAQCSDGNGGESAERARLLQKVALTTAAKRQADEALRRAVETDRQKSAEIRRLHGECRAEVARVSKDANVQIRRLVSTQRYPWNIIVILVVRTIRSWTVSSFQRP